MMVFQVKYDPKMKISNIFIENENFEHFKLYLRAMILENPVILPDNIIKMKNNCQQTNEFFKYVY